MMTFLISCIENIIIIALGLALLYVAFKFWLGTQKIAKNGTETEGVVFDLVQSNNADSQANYPLIRFVTAEKEWITEKYNISSLPGFLKKGQKVVVVYNPDNPKEFFVKSHVTSLAPILVMILALIITAIGVYKLLHV